MNRFTQGQHLAARAICNSDCIYRSIVLKRTAKTVTINDYGEVKRCKIHTDDCGEYIYPHGRHSMAATFHASEDESNC